MDAPLFARVSFAPARCRPRRLQHLWRQHGQQSDGKGFSWQPVRTLWVKGYGSDLATMGRKDFAGLRMDDIEPLLERDSMTDEEMTVYLTQCLISPNMLLLIYRDAPARLHPCRGHGPHASRRGDFTSGASSDGKKWMREILWRPRRVGRLHSSRVLCCPNKLVSPCGAIPQIECVVMGKHGLVTWGDEPKNDYSHTISIIQETRRFYCRARQSQTRVLATVSDSPSPMPPDVVKLPDAIMPTLPRRSRDSAFDFAL